MSSPIPVYKTKIYASSSRGVPHHARDDNDKGAFSRHKPLFLTKKVISPSNQRAGSDNASRFKEEIWPLISKEIKSAYCKALFEKKKLEDRDKFWEDVKQGVKNFTKYGQKFLIDRQRFKEDLEKFIRELDEDSSEAAKLQSLGVLEPPKSPRRPRLLLDEGVERMAACVLEARCQGRKGRKCQRTPESGSRCST
ncbi:hypothetical protein DID88_006233 [Monilinia fructigena]|uniref:Uncharacterized protein n=1 Tax=Monilinia fructigena TaxID=38457 RepID=A0A395J4G9_9HELO|nr:hypothetical protein DID88_006233 [Monilinia fructigena]